MHVQELNRLRAQIKLDGREGNYLMEQRICKGGLIMATDLRACCFSCDCSPLTLVTLVAKGETIVNRVYHLDRGFERLEENWLVVVQKSNASQCKAFKDMLNALRCG
ncbi:MULTISPECIES: hypothetical protein [unclassified Bartonella]|uniref:hypothetical protein n=1 Tax=unclassified Bartonella TaxID=2645622 RepID=UPI0035CF2A0B